MLDEKFEKRLMIVIDGPAAAGKSTAAKQLAERLGYLYLDTGALYRAIAWKVLTEKIAIDDESAIAVLCRNLQIKLFTDGAENEVWVDNMNVTHLLRSPEVTAAASTLSALPVVREKLLSIQQDIGRRGGVVAEGRDMGTVVFPDADLKFYLDAAVSVRGRRRYEDSLKQGHSSDLGETTRDLKIRDLKDCSRTLSPLEKGRDAIIIDSTKLDAAEVLEKMLKEVDHRLICH